MSKFLVVAIPMIVLSALSANAQSSDTNPNGNSNNVFLDNHRPLIQKKGKPPVARTVSGKVVDDSGKPLEGAIVTLTNTKTHERTQFITKGAGRYSFEDVSFTIDYDLQARYRDSTSDARRLSQYDHTANVVRILQVGATSTAKK